MDKIITIDNEKQIIEKRISESHSLVLIRNYIYKAMEIKLRNIEDNSSTLIYTTGMFPKDRLKSLNIDIITEPMCNTALNINSYTFSKTLHNLLTTIEYGIAGKYKALWYIENILRYSDKKDEIWKSGLNTDINIGKSQIYETEKDSILCIFDRYGELSEIYMEKLEYDTLYTITYNLKSNNINVYGVSYYSGDVRCDKTLSIDTAETLYDMYGLIMNMQYGFSKYILNDYNSYSGVISENKCRGIAERYKLTQSDKYKIELSEINFNKNITRDSECVLFTSTYNVMHNNKNIILGFEFSDAAIDISTFDENAYNKNTSDTIDTKDWQPKYSNYIDKINIDALQVLYPLLEIMNTKLDRIGYMKNIKPSELYNLNASKKSICNKEDELTNQAYKTQVFTSQIDRLIYDISLRYCLIAYIDWDKLIVKINLENKLDETYKYELLKVEFFNNIFDSIDNYNLYDIHSNLKEIENENQPTKEEEIVDDISGTLDKFIYDYRYLSIFKKLERWLRFSKLAVDIWTSEFDEFNVKRPWINYIYEPITIENFSKDNTVENLYYFEILDDITIRSEFNFNKKIQSVDYALTSKPNHVIDRLKHIKLGINIISALPDLIKICKNMITFINDYKEKGAVSEDTWNYRAPIYEPNIKYTNIIVDESNSEELDLGWNSTADATSSTQGSAQGSAINRTHVVYEVKSSAGKDIIVVVDIVDNEPVLNIFNKDDFSENMKSINMNKCLATIPYKVTRTLNDMHRHISSELDIQHRLSIKQNATKQHADMPISEYM